MPTCLSLLPIIYRKSLRLTALLLLSPLFFFGQTLTGLWTGALSNDSTTVRKDQSFEIVLTEYKGKVYGYSRSEFIVDDTLYFMVKKVKGTIDGDVCEVVDDEIVSYNFRGKLDKGIKVTSIFRRNQSDSVWYLDGTWKTNATKKYYSVTGKVNLEEEKDLTASKIFPHLEELKLANDIAFYKERQEGAPIVRIAKPEKIKTEYSTKIEQLPAANTIAVAPVTPVLERAETIPPVVAVSKPTIALPKTDTKTITISSVDIVPAVVTKTIAENVIPDEQIAAVTKPAIALPKTDTKTITTGQVNIIPAAVKKTIAENKIPDEEVAAVTNPSIALPKTDTKNIPAAAVTVSSTTKTIVENKVPDAVATARKKPIDSMVDGGGAEVEKEVKTDPFTEIIIKREPVPVVANNKPATVAATDNKPVKTEPVTVKQADTKSIAKTNNPVTSTSANPVTETKQQDVFSVVPVEKKPVVDIIAKAALVAGRKSEFSQIVSFKADSLELSLYDNGEIDGDTVSIYMNGEVIMSKQGLKASAIKKTIYITPGNEDFTLVLFAENLGKYPPNTGLLVIHDGDDVYNLRFSSDFEKNAGIIFRRKK
ncbi:MAG: hypothetical protein SGI96_09680 [Bacteroidota bacterium]|nr:hypothetical protein [Bacteroidota bacterium]